MVKNLHASLLKSKNNIYILLNFSIIVNVAHAGNHWPRLKYGYKRRKKKHNKLSLLCEFITKLTSSWSWSWLTEADWLKRTFIIYANIFFFYFSLSYILFFCIGHVFLLSAIWGLSKFQQNQLWAIAIAMAGRVVFHQSVLGYCWCFYYMYICII